MLADRLAVRTSAGLDVVVRELIEALDSTAGADRRPLADVASRAASARRPSGNGESLDVRWNEQCDRALAEIRLLPQRINNLDGATSISFDEARTELAVLNEVAKRAPEPRRAAEFVVEVVRRYNEWLDALRDLARRHGAGEVISFQDLNDRHAKLVQFLELESPGRTAGTQGL